MRETFRREIGLRVIFEEPVLEGLSRAVEQQLGNAAGGAWQRIERAPRGESSPLSYAQTRLWFLDQLDPGSPSYNVPLGLRISGDLRVGALEESFTQVVRRHETLRTIFRNDESGPVQIIREPGRITIEMIDLGGLDEERKAGEASRLCAAEANGPFN